MYYNELLFISQAVTVGLGAICALYCGAAPLVAYTSMLCILANLFVTKQILLLGMHATGADVFSVGATLGLNLLQEYHGRDITQKAIYTNFGLLVAYVIFCHMHLLYVPAPDDVMQLYFSVLLSPMMRIVVASFTAFFISQQVDYALYGFLKKYCQSHWMLLRNYGSMVVSQLVDTLLFSILGLYGLVSHLGEIMVVSYIIKLCAVMVAGSCLLLLRNRI